MRRVKPRWQCRRTQLSLCALQISLVPRPFRHPFFNFYILKVAETGWKGLGTTLLHIRSVSTPYLLIQLNSSTIVSLCQMHRHRTYMHVCMPKLHWSQFQTTSQKWFTNQIANLFLNLFSASTPRYILLMGLFPQNQKTGRSCRVKV